MAKFLAVHALSINVRWDVALRLQLVDTLEQSIINHMSGLRLLNVGNQTSHLLLLQLGLGRYVHLGLSLEITIVCDSFCGTLLEEFSLDLIR